MRHWDKQPVRPTVNHKIGGNEAARQLKMLGGVVAAVRRFVRARRRVNDAALNGIAKLFSLHDQAISTS
jgi:hypothetical protein